MPCFQVGPWFVLWNLYSIGGAPSCARSPTREKAENSAQRRNRARVTWPKAERATYKATGCPLTRFFFVTGTQSSTKARSGFIVRLVLFDQTLLSHGV